MLVLGSGLNMLRVPGSANVIFSLVVGMALLFIGAYGRISGGCHRTAPTTAPAVGRRISWRSAGG